MTGKEFIEGSRRIVRAAPSAQEAAHAAARVFGYFRQISALAVRVRDRLEDCPECAANSWKYLGVSHSRMEFLCDGCGLTLSTTVEVE